MVWHGWEAFNWVICLQPAADLLQYNRAQVLYHALFNHLYTPEYGLIQVTVRFVYWL